MLSMNSEGTSRTSRLDAVSDPPSSSWSSLVSALSRPAWAFLHKYFPGGSQTGNSERGKSCTDLGHTLETGLNNLVASHPSAAQLSVACVHYQHHRHAAFISTADSETLTWLNPEDPLKELGIQNTDPKVTRPVRLGSGYLSAAIKYFSQVFLNMAYTQKEVKQPSSEVWYSGASNTTTAGGWHGFCQSEDYTTSSFCQSPRSETKTPCSKEHPKGGHCELDGPGSVVAVAMPIESLVYSSKVEWIHCENTRLSCFKGSADNRGPHTARLESLPTLGHTSALQHCIVGQRGDASAAAACSEVAVLTPDQDHGYSSLEEGGAHIRQANMDVIEEKVESDSTAAPQDHARGCGGDGDRPQRTPQGETSQTADEERQHSDPNPELIVEHKAFSVPPIPHCQNKAIAYIMGSPCSDESDSEDTSNHDSDDDDDGFNSEVSSDFSDSEYLEEDEDDDDEDDDDSESDAFDSESERLWNSLCQSRDPYNPCNFTAPIQTRQKPSAATADPSPSGSPAESEELLALSSPPLLPQTPQPHEESSEEACSSMDEAESLKLWNSFGCVADPYSPLNFRAPIRTRGLTSVHRDNGPVGAAYIYRKREAEERMDSGFSEETSIRLKKVTFVEEVEEFYASGDEERRGPWEELARDRCRFQRRVQEVEESISYCLSPSFRQLIYQRLQCS